MNIYTIYKATNKLNGKVYIGFDSNWPQRMWYHKSKYIHEDYKFYRALKKYGLNSFEWSVLYQSKERDYTLNFMESYFINEYNSMSKGYNSTKGGDGVFGLKQSKKQKMAVSLAVSKPITINGITYKSKSEAINKLNISWTTLRKIEKGIPLKKLKLTANLG